MQVDKAPVNRPQNPWQPARSGPRNPVGALGPAARQAPSFRIQKLPSKLWLVLKLAPFLSSCACQNHHDFPF